MREIKISPGVFHWWITVYPRQAEDDDIDFDYAECQHFYYTLQDQAEQDWNEIAKDEYLAQINQQNLGDRVSTGVKLNDHQWFRKERDYCPVGYRQGKKEFFICGRCEKVLAGADKHNRAKNRHNPAFWGLETKEKVLCLRCVRLFYGNSIKLTQKREIERVFKARVCLREISSYLSVCGFLTTAQRILRKKKIFRHGRDLLL